MRGKMLSLLATFYHSPFTSNIFYNPGAGRLLFLPCVKFYAIFLFCSNFPHLFLDQGSVFEPLSEEEVNRRKLEEEEKTRAKMERLHKKEEKKQKQAGMEIIIFLCQVNHVDNLLLLAL